MREIIKQLFADFFNQHEIYSRYGVVTQVNSDNTCSVSFEGFASMENIPFAGISGNDGIVIKPKLNTKVLVTFTSFQTAFISYVVEPDTIQFKNESVKILLSDKVIFNAGENDGTVLINPLLEKINRLEGQINDLKTLFSSWVVAPGDGGLALKTILATWYAAQISETTKDEIENKTILQ